MGVHPTLQKIGQRSDHVRVLWQNNVQYCHCKKAQTLKQSWYRQEYVHHPGNLCSEKRQNWLKYNNVNRMLCAGFSHKSFGSSMKHCRVKLLVIDTYMLKENEKKSEETQHLVVAESGGNALSWWTCTTGDGQLSADRWPKSWKKRGRSLSQLASRSDDCHEAGQ